MKTPKYALVLRMAVAGAVVLAGSSLAVPAFAEAGPADPATASPSPSAAPAPSLSPAPTASTVSDDGLAEAIRRDLGLTLEEFNAAGELARRAADAVPSLRGLPGYVGISLKSGAIIVQGSGAKLQDRVDALNAGGPTADFILAPPAAAVPAKVPSAADQVASTTDQLFEAYLREVGPAGLQAVTYTGRHFVIRAGGINTSEAGAPALLDPQLPSVPSVPPAPGRITAAEFVARYTNVTLEQGAAIKTEAPAISDIFGGQGYVTDANVTCSAGFGAYDGTTGAPLVLTAGHCANDGASTTAAVEPAGSAPAGGATTALPDVLDPLGTFGFSQFGGPGNTAMTGTGDNPGNVGTDIAVIRDLAAGIGIQPAAAKWDNMADPGASAVKIIGTLAPFPGQPVCRSGRTTGWKCGTVDSVGIWAIPGPKSLPPNFDNDLRAVRAFDSTSVKSKGGDSGGPWISGNFAVGTHAGAEVEGYGDTRVQLRAIAATLEDAMTRLPDVQLQLFLNKPELMAPENLTFQAGEAITGRVPAAPAAAVAAGSKVRITVDGQPPTDVPVDNAGNWSVPAPAAPGRLTFTAEAVNGFSRSGAASLAVNVSELGPPVIDGPAGGATLKALSSIEGAGTPGLTVKLSGDVTGSAVVRPDGRWSVPVTGSAYGRLAVHAVQASDGAEDSPSVTRSFSVAPPAPAAAIRDGRHFAQGSLPGTISGSGVHGAQVTVSIDGVPLGPAPAGADGRWSVPFPSGLAVGTHTLVVRQSVDGIRSDPLTVTFGVVAAVVAAEASAGERGRAAIVPAGPPVRAGLLPRTGAAPELPAAGLPAPATSVPAPSASATAGPATQAAAVPAVPPARGPGAPAAPRTGGPESPDAGVESLLPAASLAGGSLLLAALLLVLGRRRAVRATPPG